MKRENWQPSSQFLNQIKFDSIDPYVSISVCFSEFKLVILHKHYKMPLGLSFASWYEYYDALPASSVVNKGKMEQLLKSFDHHLSADEAKAAMARNQDFVFLARTGLNKALGLFHHLEVSGGTIIDPEEDCAFFVGLNKANAIIATPDASVLFRPPHQDAYDVAKREDIMNCTSLQDVENLAASGGSQTIRARNFVVVPPFLVKTLGDSIAVNKENTNKIFFDVIVAIKEFDEAHKDDADFKEKAATKCKVLLHWLYVASRDDNESGIAQIQFAICTNNGITARMKEFEKKHFAQAGNPQGQVTQALVAPLEQLAASSKTTQEALLKISATQEKGSSNPSSEKSFAKIPESYRNMLLNASSIGEVRPSTMGEDAMEFFKQSGVKQAHIHLNSLLDGKGIRVSIPHSVVNALFCGAFKWSNLATPSGFAASVLETESYLRNDVLREAMVLEASTKFEILEEYVEKLTKTSIQFPTTSEDMIERFKAMRELSSFFFPVESFITQFYIKLANWNIRYRRIVDLRVAMDTKFIAKFLVATDNRVNMFLEECMKAEDPLDISPRWLNAENICESIEMNEFYYTLPASVKSIVSTNENKSRKRKAEQDKEKDAKSSERVINQNPVAEWKLREGEDYTTVFRHKVKGGPKLSMGCHGCHKFHNKGWCYTDCDNAASHCVLVGEDFEKFDARIKALRGE